MTLELMQTGFFPKRKEKHTMMDCIGQKSNNLEYVEESYCHSPTPPQFKLGVTK